MAHGTYEFFKLMKQYGETEETAIDLEKYLLYRGLYRLAQAMDDIEKKIKKIR